MRILARNSLPTLSGSCARAHLPRVPQCSRVSHPQGVRGESNFVEFSTAVTTDSADLGPPVAVGGRPAPARRVRRRGQRNSGSGTQIVTHSKLDVDLEDGYARDCSVSHGNDRPVGGPRPTRRRAALKMGIGTDGQPAVARGFGTTIISHASGNRGGALRYFGTREERSDYA